MIVSICSQLFITVALSYYLVIHLDFGILGIYIAMIADEYVRGIIALIRWRGRKYLYRVEESERDKSLKQQQHRFSYLFIVNLAHSSFTNDFMQQTTLTRYIS